MKPRATILQILGFLYFFPMSPDASAKEISEPAAIRAILGEASNQGYTGMLAVACAIRNRGTLQGVFGQNAKHINTQPKRIWDQAKQAWEESATKDITKGSTHWDNVEDFGEPYWARAMVKTVKIKNHQFYRK